MTTNVFNRRRAERFAQLLDETNGGPRHHSHGRGDDDLAGLASVGHTMTAMRTSVRIKIDAEFRTDLRAMLIATAEREGIGVTTDPGAHLEDEPRRRFALGAGSGRRLRARGAIVAGVAVGAVAVSGMSFASEDAVPGDALYGVKRSTERAQLALAGSDVTRGQLFLGFARNRLTEASAVQGGDAGLGPVLGDMDSDTREGVRLLTTSAVQRKSEAPLNAVDAFVTAQRRQIQPLLERMPAGAQESALVSMTLLDAIERRVGGLRNSFDCGTIGADGLGPLPQTCSAAPQGESRGTANTGSGERKPTGKQQQTETGRGTGNGQQGPGATTGTGTGPEDEAPATDPDPTGTADPTDEPTAGTPQAPAEQPAEEDGLLGGIFDGILG